MAGTNAVEVPAAILARLRTRFANEPAIAVDFGDPGSALKREHFWGGRASGPHNPHAFRKAGQRRSRHEVLTWTLYLRVAIPGLTQEQNARRAVELATAMEEELAEAGVQDGMGVPGCKQIEVAGTAVETSIDDQTPITVVAYTIAINSVLT